MCSSGTTGCTVTRTSSGFATETLENGEDVVLRGDVRVDGGVAEDAVVQGLLSLEKLLNYAEILIKSMKVKFLLLKSVVDYSTERIHNFFHLLEFPI